MLVVDFYAVSYKIFAIDPKVSKGNPFILNMVMDILIPVSLYLLEDAIGWLYLVPDPTLLVRHHMFLQAVL